MSTKAKLRDVKKGLSKLSGVEKKVIMSGNKQKHVADIVNNRKAQLSPAPKVKSVAAATKKIDPNEEKIKNLKSMAKKGGSSVAALGVGATIISNMNSTKGRQTNSQLYGQGTPYSF